MRRARRRQQQQLSLGGGTKKNGRKEEGAHVNVEWRGMYGGKKFPALCALTSVYSDAKAPEIQHSDTTKLLRSACALLRVQ